MDGHNWVITVALELGATTLRDCLSSLEIFKWYMCAEVHGRLNVVLFAGIYTYIVYRVD